MLNMYFLYYAEWLLCYCFFVSFEPKYLFMPSFWVLSLRSDRQEELLCDGQEGLRSDRQEGLRSDGQEELRSDGQEGLQSEGQGYITAE